MPREKKKSFQPLGDMFKLLNNLASLIEDAFEEGKEINRTGEVKNLYGVRGLKAKYGYSVKVGISENPFEKEMEIRPSSKEDHGIRKQEKTDFLVDIFDEKEYVKVLVWLPGIRGEDIKFDVTEKTLTLDVNLRDRWHRDEIELPDLVRLEDINAVYNGGVLEVMLKKSVVNQSKKHKKK